MKVPIVETNTGCLLVVDDQESNIQVVGTALGKLGFEILPVAGGLQAFQRLAVRRPDLILLDLLMPEMDGFEVCRRIRENPDWTEISIIFLSSADDKGLIVRALESGGVDYITKPFDHAELVTRVRTHLALKRARDELKQLAEDRDELLGILTHDLKNHLGGMDISAQLLRDRTEALADPKLRLMAENISHSSSQMLAFREDLYFRLNVITAEMPPLRQRPGDLIRFAGHYSKHFAALCGRRLEEFSEAALAAIRAYSWPGNLRELRNAIERAAIMAKGNKINLEDLPAELRGQTAPATKGNSASLEVGSLVSMEKLEEAHLRKVLERTSNLAEAAEVLGIDQATLYRKRKEIGLE